MPPVKELLESVAQPHTPHPQRLIACLVPPNYKPLSPGIAKPPPKPTGLLLPAACAPFPSGHPKLQRPAPGPGKGEIRKAAKGEPDAATLAERVGLGKGRGAGQGAIRGVDGSGRVTSEAALGPQGPPRSPVEWQKRSVSSKRCAWGLLERHGRRSSGLRAPLHPAGLPQRPLCGVSDVDARALGLSGGGLQRLPNAWRIDPH